MPKPQEGGNYFKRKLEFYASATGKISTFYIKPVFVVFSLHSKVFQIGKLNRISEVKWTLITAFSLESKLLIERFAESENFFALLKIPGRKIRLPKVYGWTIKDFHLSWQLCESCKVRKENKTGHYRSFLLNDGNLWGLGFTIFYEKPSLKSLSKRRARLEWDLATLIETNGDEL